MSGQQQPPEPGDDELLAQLRRIAAEADPVPELVIRAARSAFGLRDLDARLAELVRDSAVDVPATAVRGGDRRMLSFEAGDVAVECEITERDLRRDILGQLVGGLAAGIDAEVAGTEVTSTQRVTVPVDERGRFSVRDLPAGPVRLRCRLADGTTVVTSWAAM
jgi:hypothetical protein